MSYNLENGEYMIDITLSGGSGKASVKSPTQLHVDDDTMTAVIEWSSPNYDYMELGDESYYPINKDGNSRFIVSIPELDAEIPIKAETTAMSKPHMIDYTLYLDSQSAHRQGIVNSVAYEIAGVSVLAALLCAAVFVKMRYKNVKK